METENTVSRSGKGVNWTWIILGAVGLGAVWLFLSSNTAKAGGVSLPPVPALDPTAPGTPTNDSKYSLGYWAWRIKKTYALWQATTTKARISGKTFAIQLWEDAQTKVTGGDAIGADLATFKGLVDARVALDTTSITADAKFSNAVQYVVGATALASATIYGDLLPKEKNAGNGAASMAGIL
jgi:hypothetical protein